MRCGHFVIFFFFKEKKINFFNGKDVIVFSHQFCYLFEGNMDLSLRFKFFVNLCFKLVKLKIRV